MTEAQFFMSKTTTRAVFREFGQPEEVLELVEVDAPAAGKGEALVRVLASPINPADINYVQGVYGVRPDLPAVPGMEGCGEVLECPAGEFSPGDRVVFLRKGGAWATETVVPADQLVPVPVEADPVQAAMLAVNPLTALRMITGFGALQAGDWLVQNAANSNVGRCVIQLAKLREIRTINLVRRAELRDELTGLGADVVLVDEGGMVDAALEASGGVRPKLALNAVGGDSALRLMDLLGLRGTHVTYGAMSRQSLKVPNKFLIFKELTLTGYWVTKWLEEAGREEVLAAYAELAEQVARGALRQAVDREYPLEEARDACRRAQEGGRNGKVVLRMG
jgi:NADPH:quinone reductase-like Zn-dependent oxidoreductase